jgi:hypothetical protein
MNAQEIAIIIIIALSYCVCFWLISDCIEHENNLSLRIAWIAFIFFGGIIGGATYYCTKMKKRNPR